MPMRSPIQVLEAALDSAKLAVAVRTAVIIPDEEEWECELRNRRGFLVVVSRP